MVSLDQRAILVTDFDGTLTREQFFQLVRTNLVRPSEPDHWAEYQAGRVTHFDALRACFAAADGGEPALLEQAHRMGLEPNLRKKVADLKRAGWNVAVASAGCTWYIEKLLSEARVEVPVFANPGDFLKERLMMRRPTNASYVSENMGVDKARLVRRFQEEGCLVAFAGDGLPDLEAAQRVTPDLRFARDELARALDSRGETYVGFEAWGEIVKVLRRTRPPLRRTAP